MNKFIETHSYFINRIRNILISEGLTISADTVEFIWYLDYIGGIEDIDPNDFKEKFGITFEELANYINSTIN